MLNIMWNYILIYLKIGSIVKWLKIQMIQMMISFPLSPTRRVHSPPGCDVMLSEKRRV